MNSTLKSLLFWMVLVVVGVLVWNFSTRFNTRDQTISFSQFMTQVESNQVSSATISGNEISGTLKSNRPSSSSGRFDFVQAFAMRER